MSNQQSQTKTIPTWKLIRLIPELKDQECVIYYHDKCRDGFGSVYAIKNVINQYNDYKFSEPGDPFLLGDKQFVRFQYENDILADRNLTDKTVIFVDCSLKSQKMLELLSIAKKVIVIDHHASAIEDLSPIIHPNFIKCMTTDYSGAGLTYLVYCATFGSQSCQMKPMPKIIQYIQDRDLWEWKLPHSKEINQAISALKMKYLDYDNFERKLQRKDGLRNATYMGSLLLEQQNEYVKSICDVADIDFIHPYKIAISNSSNLASEIGDYLRRKEKCNIVFIWSYRYKHKNDVIVSIRTDKTFSAKDLAVSVGGGGHDEAAGFLLKNHTQLYNLEVGERLEIILNKFLSGEK